MCSCQAACCMFPLIKYKWLWYRCVVMSCCPIPPPSSLCTFTFTFTLIHMGTTTWNRNNVNAPRGCCSGHMKDRILYDIAPGCQACTGESISAHTEHMHVCTKATWFGANVESHGGTASPRKTKNKTTKDTCRCTGLVSSNYIYI